MTTTLRSACVAPAWRQWMLHIGRQVRCTREYLGLSQQEVGQRAGVSQGAVSRFESGRGLATPFVVVVKINVVLAQALRALDPETLSSAARGYVQFMDSLGVPTDGTTATDADAVSLSERTINADGNADAWMRLYRDTAPTQHAALLAMGRAAADAPR